MVPDMGLPLRGVRIVEAAQMISAPFATSLLSDQGAEVIKIEAVDGGDRMRYLGDVRNGIGTVFHACNRGKKSLALDTKSDDGLRILQELIATADVFVQNFRPGAASRMGVGAEEMCARHPELVYTSVSGFGTSGPYSDQMVYDFVIQGLIGLADIEGGLGPPQLSRHLVIDKATALTVSQAITAALFERSQTGKGQHVEVAMLDAGLQFVWPDGGWGHTLIGDDVQKVRPFSLGMETRPASDGHITLNLMTNSTWPKLCAAIDPALEADPRFAEYADRAKNRVELAEAVDAALAGLTQDEALDRLRAADLPVGPVLSLGDVADDPQVRHNDVLVRTTSSSAGELWETRPAARFHGEQEDSAGSAPVHGADSRAVLSGLGYTDEQVDSLQHAGVVGPCF